LIPFASDEGRTIFREALADATLDGYFALAEQYHTQADPAFCGLGSLVMALNALAIDPGRMWKGPWRWFSEELLDCCFPLSEVKSTGLTLDQVACLAECNGAIAKLYRAEEQSVDELRRTVEASSRSGMGPVLIASYDRQLLGQSGSGHFSPLAGYHRGRDLVLVLDVARFKYPPHWVPLSQLHAAMRAVDPVTGKSRGWLELVRAPQPRNLAFVFGNRGGGWIEIVRFIEHDLPEHLDQHPHTNARSVLKCALEHAHAPAAGIELRQTSDPDHARIVESVLVQIRDTPLYCLVRETGAKLGPEIATALLYLIPATVWHGLEASRAHEILALTSLERVPEPLRSDVRVLRRQLSQLTGCGTATAPM
jgi:glutathione gamma-glutamylcysteinyltransferase